MSEGLVIRPAAPGDAAAMAAIYAHHVRHGTATFDTAPIAGDAFAARIAAAEAGRWPWLVAALGDDVVGYAYAAPFRDRAAYASTCEDSIYVADHIRGRGTGRRLLDALIEGATDVGFRQMIAVIGGGEPASVALHRSAGFTDAGRMRSVGYKFGQWLDTVYMQRQLGPGDNAPPMRG